jgi:hypothetical protein
MVHELSEQMTFLTSYKNNFPYLKNKKKRNFMKSVFV